MRHNLLDAHIHLDMYEEVDRTRLMKELEAMSVNALIAVSNNLESSYRTLELARLDSRVKPAIGYHPEQPVPSDNALAEIMELIDDKQDQIIAIGEVGLPYYLRKENPELELQPYLELLEKFIIKAVACELPIVLHAVYEDASIVCDLLEKHHVLKAHFHWFKGSDAVLERILSNGYVISVTPDVTYKPKIQHLVKQTPLSQLMVETDGPWPFEGPFSGEMTHPSMMHHSVQAIAELKKLDVEETYRQLYVSTKNFYRIDK
ncbi:TatD family hydrolase [Sporosarcina sp. A2]|uniref:TatD family hydrolase n=1 Tax=Sporosarcina sp. A2 TaxID=3393449 RepID=UPI003D7AACC1